MIYAACCALFYVLGLYALLSKKPMGMRSSERRRSKVKDVRGYNRAIAKLFFVYGTVLLVCGVPTILEISPIAAMMISTLGISCASILLFVFAVKIEKTYRG